MKKYLFTIFIMALLLLSAGCAIEKKVEKGDTVKVDYIGKLQDGTVFDTSLIQEAQNAGIYNEQRIYEPITVNVGDGSTIPGFENGLIGMKEGQTKEIAIPPAEAYGESDPNYIISLPRVLEEIPKIQELTRFEEIPSTFQATITAFVNRYQKQPTVGMVIELTDWPGQVVEVTSTDVVIQHKPEIGKTITNDATTFTVTNVANDKITLRYDPKIGDLLPVEYGDLKVLEVNESTMKVEAVPQRQIETPYGIANVIDSGDKYVLKLNPKVGDTIVLQNQAGEVTQVTNDNMIVDFNHPLAGETLYFTVTTLTIEKAQGSNLFEQYRLVIIGGLLIAVFAAAYLFITKFYSKEDKEIKKKEAKKDAKKKDEKEEMNGELKELASKVDEVQKELDTTKAAVVKPKKPKAKKKTTKKKD